MKNYKIKIVFKENYFLKKNIAQIKKKYTSLNYKNNVSPKTKHCSYFIIIKKIFLIYKKLAKANFLPSITLF